MAKQGRTCRLADKTEGIDVSPKQKKAFGEGYDSRCFIALKSVLAVAREFDSRYGFARRKSLLAAACDACAAAGKKNHAEESR